MHERKHKLPVLLSRKFDTELLRPAMLSRICVSLVWIKMHFRTNQILVHSSPVYILPIEGTHKKQLPGAYDRIKAGQMHVCAKVMTLCAHRALPGAW